MNLYLRQVKFTGWYGDLAFETSTNKRKFLGFAINQYIFDEELLLFTENHAGNYNILSTTFFTLSGAEWYEDEVPSDIRPLYKNWSFEKYQISDN